MTSQLNRMLVSGRINVCPLVVHPLCSFEADVELCCTQDKVI